LRRDKAHHRLAGGGSLVRRITVDVEHPPPVPETQVVGRVDLSLATHSGGPGLAAKAKPADVTQKPESGLFVRG
jgi:hypothetical protein